MWLSVSYCTLAPASAVLDREPAPTVSALEKIALQKSDSETEHILHIILNGTSTTA